MVSAFITLPAGLHVHVEVSTKSLRDSNRESWSHNKSRSSKALLTQPTGNLRLDWRQANKGNLLPHRSIRPVELRATSGVARSLPSNKKRIRALSTHTAHLIKRRPI